MGLARHVMKLGAVGALILVVLSLSIPLPAQEATPVRVVRIVGNGELGPANPAGLAFSPAEHLLYTLEAPETGGTTVHLVALHGQRMGAIIFDEHIDPLMAAFDDRERQLLAFDRQTQELLRLPIGAEAAVSRIPAGQWGLQDPRGMAFDARRGLLYILDNATGNIVRVAMAAQDDPDKTGRPFGEIAHIQLPGVGARDRHGLALNPLNHHLYLLGLDKQMAYEVTLTGDVVQTFDLAGMGLTNPQGLAVAPSGDATDHPATVSLYVIASAGGEGAAANHIIEISTTPPPTGPGDVPTDAATLIKTTKTSLFSPPSPDPAGVTYLPPANSLLISDSEVNEMPPYFAGDNVFETTLDGVLLDTASTIPFSNEPTDVAWNADNGHYLFVDDTGNGTSSIRGVFDIDLGPDGTFSTTDDIVYRHDMIPYAGPAVDPEGLTFGQGRAFVADGFNEEIYIIDPGLNGVFDGLPPPGDDAVSNFDTTAIGIPDPEGVEFVPQNGYLYILSSDIGLIAETTTGGTLIRHIDISAANARFPAGLAFGPASDDPAVWHFYVVDRGVDNNIDPLENDGRLLEITFPLEGIPTTTQWQNFIPVIRS